MKEKNSFTDILDRDDLTDEEYTAFVLRRMRVMLKMEKEAKEWLKKKNTPLHRMALETSRHHVKLCEETYGVSRYDPRLY